jgi:coenzyme F420-reducing hydrogenase alpha subunit
LHSHLDGKPYLVGPLARLNLNVDRMPPDLLSDLGSSGIRFPSANMYHSLPARALEIHYALREALALLEIPPEGDLPEVPVREREGTGIHATEAPRGILWHRYDFSGDGSVARARIIPPTSQNQALMESDIARTLETLGVDRPEDVLRLEAERVVRNYDPCISCATHFLDLSLRRRD